MATGDDVVAAATRIARAIPFGFLTTVGGGVSSRVVQHLEVTESAGITFSTAPSTRKARAIANDPHVVYAVLDPTTGGAATWYATAHVDSDPDRRRSLWVEDLRPFFPDGPFDDGFVLVTIAPQRIEVWSVSDRLAPTPFGLSSAVTERTGSGWSAPVGTHPGGRDDVHAPSSDG